MSRLPSLPALHVFMTAAQHPNLSSAARALFITQSAVSKQIKNLEDQLGTPLFRRTPHRLLLTEAGEKLAASLSQAFSLIESAVTEVRKNNTSVDLTLLAPPTLATRWLSVYLKGFYADNRQIALSIVTSPDTLPVDLEIRFARESPCADAQLLTIEENILVCAPEIFEDNLNRLLEHYPILHILDGDHVLPLWSEWLNRCAPGKATLKTQFKFSTQDQVINAALHQLGLAIVDRHMVKDLVASGRLRQIDSHIQQGPYGYWLIPKNSVHSREISLLTDWLKKTCKASAPD